MNLIRCGSLSMFCFICVILKLSRCYDDARFCLDFSFKFFTSGMKKRRRVEWRGEGKPTSEEFFMWKVFLIWLICGFTWNAWLHEFYFLCRTLLSKTCGEISMDHFLEGSFLISSKVSLPCSEFKSWFYPAEMCTGWDQRSTSCLM